MESAKNSHGEVIEGEGMTLDEALGEDWTCATCPEEVPVYPTKWPCPDCTRERRNVRCRHPHFYWKARVDKPHERPCAGWSESVVATVDERIVRSRRGVPGHGPGAIRFDPPARRRADGGGGIAPDGRENVRHVKRGGVERRRGDHRVTTTEIAPACRFFIEHPDDRDQSLTVPGVPRWATRYRTVFKNLARSTGRAGDTHIWWSPVNATSMPDLAGEVLLLPMAGESRILIDRRGWGRAADAFDESLTSVFATARRAMRGKDDFTWVNVLAFGFGELGADGAIRINEARKFHVLVELSTRVTTD